MKIEKVADYIKNIICPKTCPMCDEILTGTECICGKCKNKIVYIDEPKCKKCGKHLEKDNLEYCEGCLSVQHIYDRGIAAFAYDDTVSKSIYRFKYHNRRTYANYYGRAIAGRFEDEIRVMGVDVIIPVPIHRKKEVRRGYNQAQLIAEQLGKELGILVDRTYLVRIEDTKPQKDMNRKERQKNVEKAFKTTNHVVKYNKVLLIDDIYTTGSTIDACARILKAAGVKKVYFVSLSIGQGI